MSAFLSGPIQQHSQIQKQMGILWCSLRNKWAILNLITASCVLEISPAWWSIQEACLAKCLHLQKYPTETLCDQMVEEVHIHVIFLCRKWSSQLETALPHTIYWPSDVFNRQNWQAMVSGPNFRKEIQAYLQEPLHLWKILLKWHLGNTHSITTRMSVFRISGDMSRKGSYTTQYFKQWRLVDRGCAIKLYNSQPFNRESFTHPEPWYITIWS